MTAHAPGDDTAGPSTTPPRTHWQVAPDAGRRTPPHCAHLDAAAVPRDLTGPACAQCLARGWTWRRLRWCATCGHVGCCDSSRGAHAHAHHARTGHPVAVSLAADEDWAWCFVDEVFLIPAAY
ncbi:UBP-type zinc finger domain-containing protein [Streptomyces sp. NPDC006458]|uniref:UBP-type zinc finger domain-containing protein n=1 Tax=Streptomyces sp. NPDC006458 TaxID=3154302 RepID=UPI0033A4C54A